jgi:WD40 repeat protein
VGNGLPLNNEDLSILAELLKSTQTPAGISSYQSLHLMMRGAIGLLADDQSPEAIIVLQETVLRSPLEEIQKEAIKTISVLATANNQAAVNSLYHLAIFHEHASAKEILLTTQPLPELFPLSTIFAFIFLDFNIYTKQDSDFLILSHFYFENPGSTVQKAIIKATQRNESVNLGLILQFLGDLNSVNFKALVEHYDAFNENERKLTLYWLKKFSSEGQVYARETLCQLVNLFDDPEAKIITLNNGYFPEDQIQRAIFLYLTEQWDAYQQFDFSHRLLIAGYESADLRLRRQLLTHARNSGYIDWLGQIPQARNVRWLKDLDNADWESILDQLHLSQRYGDLWRLAQSASANWSARILLSLQEASWSPTNEPFEIAVFNKLCDLAHDCLIKLPEILPTRTLKSPTGSITALALQKEDKDLVCGGIDVNLYLWDLSSRSWLPDQLIGSVPQTRALAFSPDGEYLISACGDHRIRIYRRRDFLLVKTLEGHSAQIRALFVHPDGRTLFSAGFDGVLRAWRFPFGSELEPLLMTSQEIFALHISPTGDLIAAGGADRTLRIWKWPERSLVREIPDFGETITTITGDKDHRIAIYCSDGTLNVLNAYSGKMIAPPRMVIGKIIQMACHPEENWLYTLDVDSNINVINLSTLTTFITISRPNGFASGMVISNAGDSIIHSSTQGEITFWDLTDFNFITRVFSSELPAVLHALQTRLAHPNLTNVNHRWLNFLHELLIWRTRFDIEIEEPEVLQVGEFDIQL